MEKSTLGTTLRIKDMVRVCINSVMKESTKGDGSRGSSMGLAFTKIGAVPTGKVFGRTVNV